MGFRIWRLGFRVQGSGFREGLRFRVSVYGVGFRV